MNTGETEHLSPLFPKALQICHQVLQTLLLHLPKPSPSLQLSNITSFVQVLIFSHVMTTSLLIFTFSVLFQSDFSFVEMCFQNASPRTFHWSGSTPCLLSSSTGVSGRFPGTHGGQNKSPCRCLSMFQSTEKPLNVLLLVAKQTLWM